MTSEFILVLCFLCCCPNILRGHDYYNGLGHVFISHFHLLNELVWTNKREVLAFRMTSKTKISAYNSFMDRELRHDPVRKNIPWGCLQQRGYCDRHYRSSVLNFWPSNQIDKVYVNYYQNGNKKAFIEFDGRGSSFFNWFNKTRLLNSSWSDLTNHKSYNHFSIQGEAENFRSFFTEFKRNGCDHSTGWTVVIDSADDICKPDNVQGNIPFPFFLYSSSDSKEAVFRKEMAEADVITITVTFSTE